MDAKVKKLQNALKLSGFNVRREFCLFLAENFREHRIDLNSKAQFDEIVKNIATCLENQCVSGHSIERQHIEAAVEVCLKSGCDSTESVFTVINAFDFPKLSYNQDRKLYYPEPKPSVFLAEADVKTKLFLNRYSQILQRVRRIFQHSLVTLGEKNSVQLQTVDYLLTLSEIKLDRTVILGSLFQMAEGKFCLEDPTGMIELDLAHAKFHSGFFVENIFVLVNGFYEDKILHVASIALPPGEEYTDSRPTFGNLNYFGGNSPVPLRDSKNLKKVLIENDSATFVFFSDVWLDHPEVFDKLEKVFEQISSFSQPVAFVFMGNFLSESQGSDSVYTLKRLFKRLAQIILNYQDLAKSSHFVFVPGLSDPCIQYILPKHELPGIITEDVLKILPNAIFATNPCRIQYCTKEIVIFRADVMAKFQQGTLHKPLKKDLPECMAKTIISQGHLGPMSLNALPVHWDFDYTLSLYPLPDLVVIGDRSESYQSAYKNCKVVNPGQFCVGEYPFKLYFPSNEEDGCVQDCAVENLEDQTETEEMQAEISR